MQTQGKQTKDGEKLNMDFFKNMSKGKIITISVIAVILLLNIMWSLMQNKISAEMKGIRAEMAAFSQRIAKVEQGGAVDLSSLRTEFEEMKKTGEAFAARFGTIMKIEQERLESLKKEAEMRQSWLEGMKNTDSADSGK